MSLVVVSVFTVLILGYRAFYYWAFDETMAQASGIPLPQIFFLFLSLLAVSIVASLKVVGELLVTAFMVIPASSAYQLTYSLKKMIVISIFLGALASLVGLIISFMWDVPSGASIVLVLGLEFLLSTLFSPKKRHFGRSRGGKIEG